MLTVVTWKWGRAFNAQHVNILRAMLARHLRVEHELVCVTDDAKGLEPSIRAVAMPTTYAHTPRCRRRMQGFDREFSSSLGRRLLYIDLDVVIVDDITPIVERAEPIVCWKVGFARVFSGSFILADAGALHGAWERYRKFPERFPKQASPNGIGSDQAMLNLWLKTQPEVPFWTEADGFVTYFGEGYETREHLGVGPTHRTLPNGARIVVFGSADLPVIERADEPWIRDHWRTEVSA